MFSRNRPDRDDRRNTPQNLLASRAGRQEYWLLFGALVLVSALFLHFGPAKGGVGFSGVMLIWQIRRAHDFGRTGWWAVLGQAAPLVWLALSLPALLTQFLIVLTGLIVTIAFGAIPGDPEPNRFGPPLPLRWRAAAKS